MTDISRPTQHGTEFDRYYDVYRYRRSAIFPGHQHPLQTATRNAARANAAVKRHYPRHLKWLISRGKLRLEGKPKRSRLKPVWLKQKYGIGKPTDTAFSMCLRDKYGEPFYTAHPGDPKQAPAFLLEFIYWRRCPGKAMTPAFMKYVLKEYGYDLKL